jgi:hypothetical protein
MISIINQSVLPPKLSHFRRWHCPGVGCRRDFSPAKRLSLVVETPCSQSREGGLERTGGLDQYLEISGLRNRPHAPLFRIALQPELRRRRKDAGLSDEFSPHSLRATGITNFLENGGTLEVSPAYRWPCRHPDNEALRSTRSEGFAPGYGTHSVLIYGREAPVAPVLKSWTGSITPAFNRSRKLHLRFRSHSFWPASVISMANP